MRLSSSILCLPRHVQAPVVPDLSAISPKAAGEGHKKIVEIVLPVLAAVLQDPEFSTKVPLLQAREACRRVLENGQAFWGRNETYTRKRTVEDVIVLRYISDVRMSLLE